MRALCGSSRPDRARRSRYGLSALPPRVLLLSLIGCSAFGADTGGRDASDLPPALASLAVDSPESLGALLEPDHLRLVDGRRVLLLDRRLQQIVLLSPSLGLERTFGRQGDGPGEFRALASVLALPGDSILAFDRRTQRYTLFAPEGQVAREFAWTLPAASPALPALLGGGNAPLVPMGRLNNGRLIATVSAAGREPSARHRLLVFAGPPDSGTPALLGAYPHTIPFVEGPARWGTVLYSPEAFVSVAGGAIVVGISDSTDLLVISPAGGQRALPHELERPRVTAADEQAERQRRMDRPSQLPPGTTDARAMQSAAIARTPAVSQRPAYTAMVVDPGGRAWLTACDPLDASSCEVHVIGATGGRVARYRLPSWFQLHDVGVESLVGIRDDPERGRVLEVRPLPGGGG